MVEGDDDTPSDSDSPDAPDYLSPGDSRIRDVLLKDFQEIAQDESPASDDFLSFSSVFFFGALILLVIGGWQLYRPAEVVERENAVINSLPRRGAGSRGGLLSPASPALTPVASPVARAPSPTASPARSSSPTGTASLAELVEAVRNDDVCAIAQRADLDPIPLLMAMPEYRQLSPDAQVLLRAASGGTLVAGADTFRASPTDWALFYEALLLGGLLSGVSGAGDLDRANQILQRLAGQYPANGAFPFYLLAVLQKTGADPAELDEWMRRFLSSTTFDEGTQEVYREIRNEYSGNAASSILALAGLASLPVPEATEPLRVISARLKAQPEFAPAAFAVAQHFREEEGAKSAGQEFFDWSALKVAVFTSLGRTAWSLYSEEPFPAATAGPLVFRDHRDLLKRRDGGTTDQRAFYSRIEGVYSGDKCDPEALRRAYERMRAGG